MQPQNNPQAGFNLPPVPAEQQPSVMPMEAATSRPEFSPMTPEQAPAPAAIGAVQMPTMQPPIVPAAATLPISTDVAQTTPSVVQNITEDTDLIEREWVTKAKQIVERTKEDPHMQSKELTVLKADYLQKRYNKTIKLGE